MSGFFKGPPLLVHVSLPALLNGVLFSMVASKTGSFALALSLSAVGTVLYIVIALWFGSR